MAALLLLADSQLLFREPARSELSRRLQQQLQLTPGWDGCAAYIGAANNNEPAYFQLARDAFGVLLPRLTTMVCIRNQRELPLRPCRLVILAGGNVSAGWAFLQQTRVRRWLDSCFEQPHCVIVGVSAGAIHLATGCDPEQAEADCHIQTYLGWLNRVVAVHEEHSGWPTLKLARRQRPLLPQLGIAMAGAVWASDGQLSELGAGAVIINPIERRATAGSPDDKYQQSEPGETGEHNDRSTEAE